MNTLAALMSSSARHSAMLLMFLKAASRAPMHSSHTAWLTRRSGDTSTAWRRTVPARPIRVESSRGPLLMTAVTSTCKGFCRHTNHIVNTRLVIIYYNLLKYSHFTWPKWNSPNQNNKQDLHHKIHFYKITTATRTHFTSNKILKSTDFIHDGKILIFDQTNSNFLIFIDLEKVLLSPTF